MRQRLYNPFMHTAPRHRFRLSAPAVAVALAFGLTGMLGGCGHTPRPDAPSGNAATTERRVEHLQIDDDGAHIDELRVGGETQSVTVQPKGGMPQYAVQPPSGARDTTGGGGATGTSIWKIFGF